MKKMHSLWIMLLVVSLVLVGCSGGNNAPSNQGNQGTPNNAGAGTDTESKTDFPTKAITGVIQWGVGGATDNVARALAPLVEEELGQSLVMTNKPGATGAVATQYVHDQKADGYNLLFSAENPALYGVLGISQLGFDDFFPVTIIGSGVAVVIVKEDSEYKTLEDVVAAAKANPGKIKMGSTGPGGLPHMVTSMIDKSEGTEFNMVPFDGEGPAITALLGGHIDVLVSGLTAAAENVKAGNVNALAVIHTEKVDALPDTPPVTDILPNMEQFLPWGPFYAVWTKKGTPDDVNQVLVDAFAKAQEDPKFLDLLDSLGAVPLNVSGEEADKLWRDFQSTSAWILQDTGNAKVNPEELGIPRKE